MTDKKMQGWLSEAKDPKIEQTIRLLKINKKFLKDIDVLRKKWSSFIIEHRAPIDKFAIELVKMALRGFLNKKEKPFNPNEEEKKNLSDFGKLAEQNLFTNAKLNQDVLNLCKQHKLYPISLWRDKIIIFIVTNDFSFSNKLAGKGLAEYSSSEEISQIPEDMNFSPKIEKNKDTKEQELFIQIYETTSLQDIKKYWHTVKHYQDKLKKAKKIGKRYYPKKSLETAEKLFPLDKTTKSEKYYEPTLDKWINEKITDQKKALAIYGNNLSNKKEEQKAKNTIKQIRHRYKNM